MRITPSAHHVGTTDQTGPGQPGPGHAAPGPAPARAGRAAEENAAAPDGRAPSPGPAWRRSSAPENVTARPDATRPDVIWPGDAGHGATGTHDGTVRGNGAVSRDVTPAVNAGQTHTVAADEDDGAPGALRPGAGVPARPTAARLSGPANLDPVRNPRYLMYVLRQAGVFTGIYLLIETVLLLGLLLSSAAGTKLGPALRLEMDSLWLVALVLAIPFWLIPVRALLAEWSLVMEQSSDATQTAFEHINSAFHAHGTPVDSQRVRTVSRHAEGDREYLELRRDHFSGYISCFADGHDLYVGWTFWLHMSPLRLLMMIIGRSIQDVTSRGDGIHRSLRFEASRALVAAMHGATQAGIEAASSELDPASPQLVRETAIDMNFKVG